MRFVVFTDPHIRGNTPVNRKDIFPETLLNKFQELVEIADEFKADAFLCGGDLFDAPIPSIAVAGEIMQILLSAGIPIYSIPGNHDFYAANAVTLPRTLLGYTAALQVIHLLDKPVRLTDGNLTVDITGQIYHGEIDTAERDAALDYCISKSPDCDVAIHIVHGMLATGMDFPGDLTLVEDIISTEADITIAGHNHLGWGVIETDGKYFINPGGLTRLTNQKAEMTREVGVILVEVKKDSITCEFKAMKTALPGEEVLDRTKAEEFAVLQENLQKFSLELLATTNMEQTDVTAIIKKAVTESQAPAYVLNEALKRIAIAQEALAAKKEAF